MPAIKDYALGALTLALVISLGFSIQPDANYLCRDSQITKYCDHLSSTQKTCYPYSTNRTGSKYCPSIWEDILAEPLVQSIPRSRGVSVELCSPGLPCVQIK